MPRQVSYSDSQQCKFLNKRRTLLFGGSSVITSTVLYVFSMPPWGLFPLALVALVPLMLFVLWAERRAALLAAYLFGLLLFVFLVSWLRFVTVVGWLALALYLAVYPLLFALLLRWLRRRLRWPVLLLAPLLWTSLEYTRSRLLTGFPWFLLGHSQYAYLPLMQMADLTGVYGITFVIVILNGVVVDFWLSGLTHRRQFLYAGVSVLVLAACVVYGLVRIAGYEEDHGPEVALIQGNIPMNLKHSPDEDDALRILSKHEELSLKPEARGVDLLVWPETMMPVYLNIAWDPAAWGMKPSEYFALCRQVVVRIARETGAHLLIGAVTYEPPGKRYYNSVYYFDPQPVLLGRYDKIHIVPFGEYTPLKSILPFVDSYRTRLMGPGLSPGGSHHLFRLPWRGRTLSFAVNICYEDAEAPIVREQSRLNPDFLVNVSNDAWFRDSVEMDQHLAIGRFRCVENRLPMARAYNSGISAIVDPLGRVVAYLHKDGRHREVEGVLRGRVPLARMWSLYRTIGDLFAYLCIFSSAVLCFTVALRGRNT